MLRNMKNCGECLVKTTNYHSDDIFDFSHPLKPTVFALWHNSQNREIFLVGWISFPDKMT